MNTLFYYIGGSDAYGLPKVATSDKDHYFIATYKDLGGKPKIYPNIKWHQKKRNASFDVEKLELCAFLTYLMNGHVFNVETLFIPKENIKHVDDKFDQLILRQYKRLIDRNRVQDNIFENAHALKERTLEDIEKIRHELITSAAEKKIRTNINKIHDEYLVKGFYHRDYLHAIRVASSATMLMKEGFYATQFGDFDPDAFKFCAELKKGAPFTKKEVDDFLDSRLKILAEFDFIHDSDFQFDMAYAQEVIQEFYS